MKREAEPDSLHKISEEKMAEYRAGWKEREARERSARQERYARAWKAAKAAANILRESFGANRVRVFGTVLHPEVFHLLSDIDLAAEGIDPLLVLKAWCAVSAVAPEFEFDLITPDECRPEIWASVEAEGVDV